MKFKFPKWVTVVDLWAWIAAGLALTGTIILIGWFVTEPGRARQRAAEARAARVIAEGQAKAGGDAVIILDGALGDAQHSEDQSRENADAIRKAPGADQRLSPDLNRVARERLCNRPSYRGRPECMQLIDRANPSRPR